MAADHPMTCLVCGGTGGTRMGLMRFRGPGAPYSYGPRCIDHDACRSRCEANGEAYPLSPPAPVARPTPERRPALRRVR